MINHKIAKVPDAVCEECSQLWLGRCRAYSVAHSEEELEHRKTGALKCDEGRRQNILTGG